jgi:hypothetical protein
VFTEKIRVHYLRPGKNQLAPKDMEHHLHSHHLHSEGICITRASFALRPELEFLWFVLQRKRLIRKEDT